MQAVSTDRDRFDDARAVLAAGMDDKGSWVDDETFRVALNRNGMTLGSVAFRSLTALTPTERDDLTLTLTSACRPMTTGLEIIALRA